MGSYKHLNVEEKEYVRLPKNVLEDMFSTYHKMESYIETLEILSNKRLVSKLKESKRQKERGELLSWNEFRKVIE